MEVVQVLASQWAVAVGVVLAVLARACSATGALATVTLQRTARCQQELPLLVVDHHEDCRRQHDPWHLHRTLSREVVQAQSEWLGVNKGRRSPNR